MGFDPAGDELENFRVDWLADRTAVGPRPGQGGVGAEQVAEVAGYVAFEGPLGEAADLRHVLRRYLWPGAPPGCSDYGWMWLDAALCLWSLAPRLAPRDLVNGANVRLFMA